MSSSKLKRFAISRPRIGIYKIFNFFRQIFKIFKKPKFEQSPPDTSSSKLKRFLICRPRIETYKIFNFFDKFSKSSKNHRSDNCYHSLRTCHLRNWRDSHSVDPESEGIGYLSYAPLVHYRVTWLCSESGRRGKKLCVGKKSFVGRAPKWKSPRGVLAVPFQCLIYLDCFFRCWGKNLLFWLIGSGLIVGASEFFLYVLWKCFIWKIDWLEII